MELRVQGDQSTVARTHTTYYWEGENYRENAAKICGGSLSSVQLNVDHCLNGGVYPSLKKELFKWIRGTAPNNSDFFFSDTGKYQVSRDIVLSTQKCLASVVENNQPFTEHGITLKNLKSEN